MSIVRLTYSSDHLLISISLSCTRLLAFCYYVCAHVSKDSFLFVYVNLQLL